MTWLNFTAVGGSLIYFGARRPWREMLAPLGLLMLTDYCLTTFTYDYAFHWQSYVITWTWYVAAMALGAILLSKRTTFARGAAGAILGPTSSSWSRISESGPAASTDIRTRWPGSAACYAAGVPFYRNDLISTSIVLGVALGVPVLVRRMRQPWPARKGA